MKIIKREVVKEKENSDINWNDVQHILEASRMALFPNEYGAGVFKKLHAVETEYGCWLDCIDEGLKIALNEVPDRLNLHGKFYGSYSMAKIILLENYHIKREANAIVGKL